MYLDYVQLQGGITTTTTEVDPLSVHITDSAAMLSPYLRTLQYTFENGKRKALSSNITLGLASVRTDTTVLHGNYKQAPFIWRNSKC
jgi:hypothetical protein